jgi:hypothetical protein
VGCCNDVIGCLIGFFSFFFFFFFFFLESVIFLVTREVI